MRCRKTFLLLAFVIVSTFSCQNSDPATDDFYKAILTNNKELLSTYLDGHDPEKLVLLPTEMILEIDKEILRDSILHQFIEVKKALYFLNIESAKKQLKALLNVLATTDYQLLNFEANSMLAYFDFESVIERVRLDSGKTDSSSSFYEVYKYLTYLKILSIHYIIEERSFKALATIEYALHLIATSSYKNEFKSMEASLLKSKANLLINENHDYERHQKISNQLLEQAFSIYENLDLSNQAFETKAEWVNSLLNSDSVEIVKSGIDSLSSLLPTVDPSNKNTFHRNIGIHYFQNGRIDEAIKMWNKSNELLLESRCSQAYLFNQLYLVHAYNALNNVDSMDYYFSQMDAMKSCGDFIKTHIDFYAEDVISMINQKKYNQADQRMSIDTFLNPLINKRDAAFKIFPNKAEFHLGDFYAQNSAEILKLLLTRYEEHPLSEKHSDLILTLFFDTKSRELKRKTQEQELTDTIKIEEDIDVEIQKCLHTIDDFKVCDDYTSPIYERLFDLYQSKSAEEISNIAEEKSLSNLSAQAVFKKISQTNQVFYEYFLYGENYFGIFLSGSESRIFSFSKLEFDSLFKSYLETLLTKGDVTSSGLLLKKMLIPFKVDSADILIIPDGDISFIPFSDLLPESKVQFHYDLKKLLSEERLNLEKTSIGLLSYSDDSTINDKSVRSFPELSYGYQECKNIAALFNNAELYAGAQCNRENLSRAFNKAILHVSTHGFANSSKRQDCFLLLRGDNDYERMYSTDILSVDHIPQFVLLSACDSGLGQFMSAEGVYSISRSFFQAGSNTVIKTLWKVNDRTTEVFTKYFYQEWDRGLSAGHALYSAQQKMKTLGFKEPYYWAGFILEGNQDVYLSD